MTRRPTRLARCGECGRLHFPEALIPDPDRPPRMRCPVRWRGMRLPRWEREEGNRLLRSAFGDESAPGHPFPASDEISWLPDAADDGWWES